MNPKKIDQIGCIDIGSNAIKYKQFRIIADDNQNYSKELETYKRIPIRLGTDAFRKGKIRKKKVQKTSIGRRGRGIGKKKVQKTSIGRRGRGSQD